MNEKKQVTLNQEDLENSRKERIISINSQREQVVIDLNRDIFKQKAQIKDVILEQLKVDRFALVTMDDFKIGTDWYSIPESSKEQILSNFYNEIADETDLLRVNASIGFEAQDYLTDSKYSYFVTKERAVIFGTEKDVNSVKKSEAIRNWFVGSIWILISLVTMYFFNRLVLQSGSANGLLGLLLIMNFLIVILSFLISLALAYVFRDLRNIWKTRHVEAAFEREINDKLKK